MGAFISYLNDNNGAFIVLLTFVLICVTIYYAWQTKEQAQESKKNRESIYRPYLACGFELGTNRWGVKFYVRNAGKTSAYDINIKLNPPLINKEGITIFSSVVIPCIVPGSQYDEFVGFSDHFQGPNIDVPDYFNSHIAYISYDKQHYQETFYISLKAVLKSAVSGGNMPPIFKIPQELNIIALHLREIIELLRSELERGNKN